MEKNKKNTTINNFVRDDKVRRVVYNFVILLYLFLLCFQYRKLPLSSYSWKHPPLPHCLLISPRHYFLLHHLQLFFRISYRFRVLVTCCYSELKLFRGKSEFPSFFLILHLWECKHVWVLNFWGC